LGYRLEYDSVTDVPAASLRALGPFDKEGLLSGLSAGFLWNHANDPLNPTTGWVLSFAAEEVGGFLGGRFDFYKLQSEIKGYYPLAEKTVVASRLKIGFAEPLHGGEEVPIFERFYSGGSASVRGYGRSRLGPLSTSDDPLGGRSLIEGSFELRQQFTEKIGGALFVDFGQVSLRSFDVPVDDLRFSAGVGGRYTTPAGPGRLDLEFHDVAIVQNGETILSAPVVSIDVGLWGQVIAFLSASTIRIGQIDIVEPELKLVQDEEKNWNLAKLVKKQDKPEEPGQQQR